MKRKAKLIDPTKCIGCRGCQVACKQWNALEAECTTCEGSYENPRNLSPRTYTLVRFTEKIVGGKIKWLFAKENCRHCDDPGCFYNLESAEGKIEKLDNGAVVFTENLTGDDAKAAKEGCPFGTGFPQIDEKTGLATKCTLCPDRVENGMLPACVHSCPTGALMFGDKDEMIKTANARIEELKKQGLSAEIYPGTDYSVMWILCYPEEDYHLM